MANFYPINQVNYPKTKMAFRVFLTLVSLLGIFQNLNAQNGFRSGDGWGSGWGTTATGTASAGTSYIWTYQNSSGAGNRYFRFYSTASSIEHGPNSANDVQQVIGAATTLPTVSNSTKAYYISVANSTNQYVFKTPRPDGSSAANAICFEVQSASIPTISTVSGPTTGSVFNNSSSTVNITWSAARPNGMQAYLRYSNTATFTSSNVVAFNTAVGSTSGSAIIPASANNNSTVYYYVFTSGDQSNVLTDLNGSPTNSDWYTINLNNNTGSNFNYSVGTSTYTGAGGTLDWTLNSSWTSGGAPTAGSTVVINPTGAVTFTNVPTVTLASLTVGGSAQTTITPSAAGNTVTISGGLTLTQTLSLSASQLNITLNGTLTASSGTLDLSGAAHNLTLGSGTTNTIATIKLGSSTTPSIVFGSGTASTLAITNNTNLVTSGNKLIFDLRNAAHTLTMPSGAYSSGLSVLSGNGNSTVYINTGGASNLISGTYQTLRLAGGADYTLTGNVTIANTLTQNNYTNFWFPVAPACTLDFQSSTAAISSQSEIYFAPTSAGPNVNHLVRFGPGSYNNLYRVNNCNATTTQTLAFNTGASAGTIEFKSQAPTSGNLIFDLTNGAHTVKMLSATFTTQQQILTNSSYNSIVYYPGGNIIPATYQTLSLASTNFNLIGNVTVANTLNQNGGGTGFVFPATPSCTLDLQTSSANLSTGNSSFNFGSPSSASIAHLVKLSAGATHNINGVTGLNSTATPTIYTYGSTAATINCNGVPGTGNLIWDISTGAHNLTFTQGTYSSLHQILTSSSFNSTVYYSGGTTSIIPATYQTLKLAGGTAYNLIGNTTVNKAFVQTGYTNMFFPATPAITWDMSSSTCTSCGFTTASEIHFDNANAGINHTWKLAAGSTNNVYSFYLNTNGSPTIVFGSGSPVTMTAVSGPAVTTGNLLFDLSNAAHILNWNLNAGISTGVKVTSNSVGNSVFNFLPTGAGNIPAGTYQTLNLSNTSATTYTLNGSVTVNKAWTLGAAHNLTFGTAQANTLTLGTGLALPFSSGTIDMTGASHILNLGAGSTNTISNLNLPATTYTPKIVFGTTTATTLNLSASGGTIGQGGKHYGANQAANVGQINFDLSGAAHNLNFKGGNSGGFLYSSGITFTTSAGTAAASGSNAGSTVTYSGAGINVVPSTNYENLSIIQGTGGDGNTYIPGATITCWGNFTIGGNSTTDLTTLRAGQYGVAAGSSNAFTLNVYGNYGTLVKNLGGGGVPAYGFLIRNAVTGNVINLYGTNNSCSDGGFQMYNSGTAVTLNYLGANQTVFPLSNIRQNNSAYMNINIGGTGIKTLGNNGGVFFSQNSSVSGTNTLNVTSTLAFGNTTAITFDLANSGTTAFNITGAGTIDLSGNSGVNHNLKLFPGSTNTIGKLSFGTLNSPKVTFGSSGSATTFNVGTTSSTGIGSFDMTGPAHILNFTGGGTLSPSLTFSNTSGTATTVNYTYTGGATATVIPATSTATTGYQNLNFPTLGSQTYTLAGNLNANVGINIGSSIIATTSSYKLTIPSGQSLGRTSGWVSGTLEKYVSTTNPTFEIGGASRYASLTYSFASAPNGLITAKTTDGNHPNIATSLVDPANNIARYWTTGGAALPASYGLTFNYSSGDNLGSPVPATFTVAKYLSGIWSSPTISGTPTATQTIITGGSGAADFAIGNATGVVSVSITPSPLANCSGTSVTYTATPLNASSPSYLWKVNGNTVAGQTGTTYTYTPNAGDVVLVQMTSGGTPYTFSVTATASLTPSVSIASNLSGSQCIGTSQTFTATPTNGGGSPSYNFMVNGVSVQSGVSPTYTTTALNNGDLVTCIMTTTYSCPTSATATSNTFTAAILGTSISSQPVTASSCSGTNVNFIVVASSIGGATLTYQWQVSTNSGSSYSNVSGGTYTGGTTANLTVNSPTIGMNGYLYKCIVTPGSCASVTSSVATLSVVNSVYTIPSNGLYAWWPFNGNTNDLGPNNYSLNTGGGSLTSPSSTTDRFGVANNAYAFNGTSTNMYSNSLTFPSNNTYSYVVWFKTASAGYGQGGYIFGTGNNPSSNSSGYDRLIYMTNAGKLIFGVYNGGQILVTSANNYNDGNWHLAVATSDGSNITLSVDGGTQVTTTGTSGTNTTSQPYFRVGNDNLSSWNSQPTSFFFSGSIDDIAVYSRSLSFTEISQIYNGTYGIPSNQSVCAGNPINLYTNGSTTFSGLTGYSGTTFQWSGPNLTTTSTQAPSGITATAAMASTNPNNYVFTVSYGGCSFNSTTAYTVSNTIPAVTTQPASRTICVGSTYSLTAAASSIASPTYQWYQSTNSGTTFTAISGATSSTYNLVVASTDNGKLFNCVISGGSCPVTSNSATLTTVTGSASVYTWIGNSSADWNDVANWCGSFAALPTSSSAVTIPSGTAFSPTITNTGGTAAVCGSLTINSGATLSISGSGSLTLNGSFTNNGTFSNTGSGNITFSTGFTNNGSFANTGSGQLIMNTNNLNIALSVATTLNNLNIPSGISAQYQTASNSYLTISGTTAGTGTFRVNAASQSINITSPVLTFSLNNASTNTTFTFSGNVQQTLPSTPGSNGWNNLVIAQGVGGSVISSSSIDISGGLTFNTSNANTLTMQAGHYLRTNGVTITMTGAAHTINLNSTGGYNQFQHIVGDATFTPKIILGTSANTLNVYGNISNKVQFDVTGAAHSLNFTNPSTVLVAGATVVADAANASTVTYSSNTNGQVVLTGTYNQLTFNNSSKTLGGSITCYGTFNTNTNNLVFGQSATSPVTVTMQSGAVLTGSGSTFDMSGGVGGDHVLNLGGGTTTSQLDGFKGGTSNSPKVVWGTGSPVTFRLNSITATTTGNITFDMTSTSHTLWVYGWGTFSSGTSLLTTPGSGSTVLYNRNSGNWIFASPNYQNLSIIGGATQTMNGNVTVNGTLTISNGTLAFGSTTANTLTVVGNIAASGQTIDMSATTSLNHVLNLGAGSTNTLGTLTTNTTNTPKLVFGNTAATLTLSNAWVGNLTLDMQNAAHYLSVGGCTTFPTQTTLLSTDGSGSTIQFTNCATIFPSTRYQNLTLSANVNYTLPQNPVVVNGNFTQNTGSLYFSNATSSSLTVNGNFDVSNINGGFQFTGGASAIYTINLNGSSNLASARNIWNYSNSSTMTLNFGGANQSIMLAGYHQQPNGGGGTPQAPYTVTFGGSGTKTLTGNFACLGNLTIGSGVTIAFGTDVTSPNYLATYGTFTSNGVLDMRYSSHKLVLGGATSSWPTNGILWDNNGATVIYASTANQSVFGTSYPNLSIDGGGASQTTITLGGDVTVNGNFSIANTQYYSSSAGYIFSMGNTARNLTVTGNFTGYNNSLMNIDLSGAAHILNVAGNITTYYFTGGTSSTVTLNGTSNQTISGNNSSATTNYYNNLTVSGVGTTKTLTTSVQINGTLSLLSGTYNNSGQTLTLGNGATISLSGGVLGGSPSLAGNYNLIYNTATTTGYELLSNATRITNFTISNSAGTIALDKNLTVNGTFTLGSNSYLDLGNFNAVITSTGSLVPGTSFGSTSMIITSGTGYLKKKGTTAANLAITYPVGTGSYYTPLVITSLSGTVASADSFTVRAVPSRYSNAGSNAATKYWDISTGGITGITGTYTVTYNSAEAVTGQAGNYIGRFWDLSASPNVWNTAGGTVSATGVNPVTFTGVTNLTGYVTVGTSSDFPSTIWYSLASGNWNSVSSWSNTGYSSGSASRVPTAGDFVSIGNGRIITISTNGLSAANINIDATGSLELGTSSGHTFTTVGGTGTIQFTINTSTNPSWPSGDFSNFVGNSGGKVTYLGGGSYTLPSQLTYNSLTVLGGGTKTGPSGALTINGSLNISGSTTILNIVNDVTLFGTGSSAFGNSGTYNQTAGTLYFNGNGTQTVTQGVALTFNNLQIGANASVNMQTSNYTLNGNLINNSTSINPLVNDQTNGQVTFNGTTAISGTGAGILQFNDFVINSGVSVTTTKSLSVTGQTFTNNGSFVASAGTFYWGRYGSSRTHSFGTAFSNPTTTFNVLSNIGATPGQTSTFNIGLGFTATTWNTQGGSSGNVAINFNADGLPQTFNIGLLNVNHGGTFACGTPATTSTYHTLNLSGSFATTGSFNFYAYNGSLINAININFTNTSAISISGSTGNNTRFSDLNFNGTGAVTWSLAGIGYPLSLVEVYGSFMYNSPADFTVTSNRVCFKNFSPATIGGTGTGNLYFGDIQIDNAATGTSVVTINKDISVNGRGLNLGGTYTSGFTINTGACNLNANLTITGAAAYLTNTPSNTTGFNITSGKTVTFTPINSTGAINKPVTLSNLVLNGNVDLGNNSGNSVVVNGTANLNSYSLNSQDGTSNTFTFNGLVQTAKSGGFNGWGSFAINTNGKTTTLNLGTSSVVEYNNSGSQTVTLPSGGYPNLKISGTGTKTITGSGTTIPVTGTLVVNSTLAFGSSGVNTLNLTGALSGTGTIDMTGAAHNLTLAGSSNAIGALTTDANSSTVSYTSSNAQTIFASTNYRNLSLTNGGTDTLIGNIQVAGTLNIGTDNVVLGNYNVTVGTGASNTGTLTNSGTTGGYFVTTGTGKLTRWFGTTGLPTSTGGTGIGYFPLGNATSNRNVWVYFSNATALSSAGTISVVHGDSVGVKTITPTITESAYTINNVSRAYWTLSSANGLALSGTAGVSVQGTNAVSPTALTNLRAVVSTGTTTYGFVGTHANGSGTLTNPVVSRTGLSISNLNNSFSFGGNNTDLPNIYLYAKQNGNWETASTWDQGFTPTSSNVVIVKSPYSVILGTGTFAASTLTVNSGGSVNFGTNTLTLSGGAATLNGTILTANPNGLNSSSSSAISTTNSPVVTLGSNSIVNYNASTAQTIDAIAYGNLTISGTSRSGNVTLGSGTLSVSGTFNPTATFASGNNYVTTGNTFTFNGSNQTIPAFNYNNLSNSGSGTTVLALSGTVGIAGSFTPGSATYSTTGSTVLFNGASSSTQSIPVFNFNNLSITGGTSRTINLPSGQTGIAGAFVADTTFTYSTTGNTINFNGSGSQTIPGFKYNNLTSSGSGARTLGSAGYIHIFGTFTPGSNTFTNTGSTIDFNGIGAQTLSAFTYNNLIVSGARGSNNVTFDGTGSALVTVNGNLDISPTFSTGIVTYANTSATLRFANGSNAVNFNLANNVTVWGLSTTGSGNINITGGNTFFVLGTWNATGTSLFKLNTTNISFGSSTSLTQGGFNNAFSGGIISNGTGTVTKWYGANGISTNGTPDGNPSGTQGSWFPFYSTDGLYSRSMFVSVDSSSSNQTTGGSVTIRHVENYGLNTVSFTEGGNTFDRQSKAYWAVSSSGITLTGNAGLRLIATYSGLFTSSDVTKVALNNIGYTARNAGKATYLAGANAYSSASGWLKNLSTSQFNDNFYLYGNSSYISVNVLAVSTAGGDWSSASSWNTGSVPTAADNVTIPTGTTITLMTGTPVAKSSIIVNGTLDLASKTITMASGGTVTNNGYIKTSGSTGLSAIVNGTVTNTTGSTVEYNGSTTQTVSNLTYYNLVSSNTGGRSFGTGNTTINGAFTNTGTGTWTSPTAGTVTYSGGAQTILALPYFNLTSTGSSSRTLASTGTIQVAGAFTPGTNTYTITGSTIQYNGTGSQTITPFTYNNLDIAARASGTITIGTGTVIDIAGSFTNSAVNSGLTYAPQTSTVNFSSGSPQTIPPVNFYNVTNTGNGNRTFSATGTIRFANTFTPGSGNYTTTGSTVGFNGAGQTIPSIAPASYNNLTINTSSSATPASNVSIGSGGKLTLLAGNLNNAGTNVTLANGATIEMAGGSLSALPTLQGTVNMLYSAAASATTGIELPTSSSAIGKFIVSAGAGNTVTFASGLNPVINDSLVLTSGALSINGNTLTLNGKAGVGTGTLNGSASSNLVIGGTSASGSFGTLTFGSSAANKTLASLTINRAGIQDSLQLGSNLTVPSVTFGASAATILNTKTFTLDLGATGSISGEKNASYLVGTLTTNRAVNNLSGSTENFGNTGVSIVGCTNCNLGTVTITRKSGANAVKKGGVGFSSNTSINRTYDVTPTNQPNGGKSVYVQMNWLSADDRFGSLPTSGRVFKSTDNGTTWSRVGLPFSFANRSIVVPTTSFSTWTIADDANPLPLNLISFSGSIVKGAPVLNWKTAMEINNDYYEVLRSLDGVNFTSVGKVKAKGNSNTETDYTFTDNATKYLNQANVYYRLKARSTNGEDEYYNIISLHLGNLSETVSVYPNPSKGDFNLVFNSNINLDVEYTLTDNVGRVVKQGRFDNVGAGLENKIVTDGMPAGIYNLRLIIGEEVKVFKLNKE